MSDNLADQLKALRKCNPEDIDGISVRVRALNVWRARQDDACDTLQQVERWPFLPRLFFAVALICGRLRGVIIDEAVVTR